MSEQAQKSNQQTLVIGLGAVAVLLAAIVGIVIYFQSQANSIPAPTGAAQPSSNAATSTGAPAGMGGGAATPVAFDAKTATKVPSGTEPADFVKAYHEAVQNNKYADAYKMLPLDKQQSYGDAKAYEEQVKSYGITSYRLGKPATQGDTVSIAAEQVTPQMPITYTWTFKKVDGQWYVESRAMGGSVQ